MFLALYLWVQNLQWVLDVFRKRDEDDAANEPASKREETKCQNTQQEAFCPTLFSMSYYISGGRFEIGSLTFSSFLGFDCRNEI